MKPQAHAPRAPENTGAWSLFELRRHFVRTSGTLTARARWLRSQGDVAAAVKLLEESRRLRAAARTIEQNDPDSTET